jgi:hypothetical protein
MKRFFFIIVFIAANSLVSYSQIEKMDWTYEQKINYCLKIYRDGLNSSNNQNQLREFLTDSSIEVQRAAINAIGKIGDSSSIVIKILTDKLNSYNEDIIRSASSIALLNLGSPGISVLRNRAYNAGSVKEKVEAIVALRSVLPGLVDSTINQQMKYLYPEIDKLFNPGTEKLPGSPITNGDFQLKDFQSDWIFKSKYGGQGKILIDSVTRSRDGGYSIKITKSNSEGEVYLQSKKYIKVKKNRVYFFRIYFRSDTAPTISSLQILFKRPNGQIINGTDAFAGDGQTFLHNSAPGEWCKRMAKLEISENGNYYIIISLRGNPSTVWIDDISFPSTNALFNIAPFETIVYQNSKIPFSGNKHIIPSLPSINKEGNRSRLYIDSKKIVPAMYFSYPTEYGDYSGIDSLAGIKLLTVSLPFGDMPGYKPGIQPAWQKDKLYDFSSKIETIKFAIERAPESNIIVNLGIYLPQDWIVKHPEEVWKNERGKWGYGTLDLFEGFSDTLPQGKRWWPSPFSLKGLEDIKSMLMAFLDTLKNTPYINKIIGFHIEGGHDGQFFTGIANDYSSSAQSAFRSWLKEKYKTIGHHQYNLPSDSARFSNVNLPGKTKSEVSKNIFFNPATERIYADQKQFQFEQGMIIKDEIAKTLKHGFGRPVLGMSWTMWGGRGQGIERIFLNSKNLDILIPQPIYPRRIEGYLGGLRNIAIGSYAYHNKIILKELDLRTWLRNSNNINDNEEPYTQWVGTSTNPRKFKNTFRKELAQMIAVGQGFWMYDILGTQFRDPDILQTIKNGIDVYKETELSNNKKYKPEVAVVWVDDSQYWEKSGLHTNNGVTINSHTGFHMLEAGFTFEDLYLTDILENNDLQQFKMYIFKDAWRLTNEQKLQIDKKLKKNGITLVWNYAPGYIGDDKLSDDYVSAVTGMKIYSKLATDWPKVRYSVKGGAITKNLKGITGMGEINAIALAKGPLPSVKQLPEGYRKFIINDVASQTIATYADGTVAVAIKKFKNWSSVYFGMLGTMDGYLLSKIAVNAGVHLIADPGVGLEYNGTFLSLTGVKNGIIKIHLPQRSALVDIDTNGIFAEGKELSFFMSAGETRWFKIIPF